MAWTSPRTWVSGEILTAALLNTHLRDNLLAVDAYVGAVETFVGGISDDTVSSATTKTWDLTTELFADPGRNVNVVSWFQGYVKFAADAEFEIETEISFDGSGYTATGTGKILRTSANTLDDMRAVTVLRRRQGTPTGAIQGRARMARQAGTGTITCTNGEWVALMVSHALT